VKAVGSEHLLLARDGRLATITLNRPEVRNALSHALRLELAAALDELAADDEVSVAILTGASPAFCAGFDLSEFEAGLGAFDDQERWESGRLMHEALARFPKPLVGAINGPALGGGFDVAVQCDVRIASEAASFGHPEIKLGAPTLYTILAQIVGGAVARDLCLSGRRIDASEALRVGLVQAVTAPDRLMDEARAYARAVAEAPLETLKAVKAAIVRSAPFRAP
jgi:enoyl-CoA hydratase/carnithine racemase